MVFVRFLEELEDTKNTFRNLLTFRNVLVQLLIIIFFLKIGQLGEAKDQLQMIDVEHSKTQNRVEVLGQVIFLFKKFAKFNIEDIL